MEKQKILIADDSEMNRALLVDILEDQYDIVEADNLSLIHIFRGAVSMKKPLCAKGGYIVK